MCGSLVAVLKGDMVQTRPSSNRTFCRGLWVTPTGGDIFFLPINNTDSRYPLDSARFNRIHEEFAK